MGSNKYNAADALRRQSENNARPISELIKSRDGKTKRAQKTNNTTKERIWNFYHDKAVELNEKEDELRNRWEKAWLLLTNHKTQKQSCDELQKLFDIQQWQAYDDIKNAMLLFGDPGPQFKAAKRAIAESMILKAMEKAFEGGNLDVYERLIGRYMKNAGLEINDGNDLQEKLKTFRPVNLTFVVDSDFLNNQAKELLNNIPAEEVNFEEVK